MLCYCQCSSSHLLVILPTLFDCSIFVPDMKAKEREWKQMRSHTWGKGNYFGQYEGKSSRAACEGMVTTYVSSLDTQVHLQCLPDLFISTLSFISSFPSFYSTSFNTMPDRMVNTKVISPYLPTNAGVDRTKPSAGSITHHFGIHGEALDIITAGSELTVNYGDWDFDESIEYKVGSIAAYVALLGKMFYSTSNHSSISRRNPRDLWDGSSKTVGALTTLTFVPAPFPMLGVEPLLSAPWPQVKW